MTEPATSRALRHRDDIDGLRAIAVLSVILFHAGVPGFGGGYVGVDVFFVISGYLISGILLREQDAGRISLASFYERRVRRIFPALFVMFFVTSVVGYCLLLPPLFKAFGRSLVAATLFVSNVLYYSESGYFDAPSEAKPLLHTWSLGVEEQFYIFFPLYVAVVWKYLRGRAVVLTALVTAVSFAASIWGVTRFPKATFFLAPTRAGELLLGALIAMAAFPAAKQRVTREGLTLLGVALILVAVVAFSATDPFPGWRSLVPCVGAALLMHGGQLGTTLTAQALASRPFKFVGQISYSLYLWHWPVLMLAKYWAIRELSSLETATVLLLAGLLSVASWRWVERPFRERRTLTRATLFALAGGLMAAFVAVGAWIDRGQGLPGRLKLADQILMVRGHDGRCSKDVGAACSIGKPSTDAPTFAVWGDSHAQAAYSAIDAAARAVGAHGMFFGRGGCPPILGVVKLEPERTALDNEECTQQNRLAFEQIAAAGAVTRVLLVSRWPYFLNGEGYGVDAHLHVSLLAKPGAEPMSLAERESAVAASIQSLLRANKSVVLVETVPEFLRETPDAIGRTVLTGRNIAMLDEPAERAAARVAPLARIAARFAAEPRFRYLRTHPLFCAAGTCRSHVDGLPLYDDNSHIGPRADARLEPLFADALTAR
ncbi:MAG TPA: acyltransferase family protein [Polyangiaceae bacterium]|nr:acyltransferase family protein [Polyangiaceae bacterium]